MEDCPVCGQPAEPKCSKYKECPYKKMDLVPLGVCFRRPEMCDLSPQRKQEEVKFNPTER